MRRKAQRCSRVTRRSTENNHQSRSLSERSRRYLLPNEQAPVPEKRRSSEDRSNAAKKRSQDSEKVQRKVDGLKKYDMYCWICHKDTDEFYCANCPRVYHSECRKKIKNAECICKNPSLGLKSSKLEDLKTVLGVVLNNILNEKKNKKQAIPNLVEYFFKWPALPKNDSLLQIYDISRIADNIGQKFYKSQEQFYQDIKWMYHNCCIAYGADHEKTVVVQKFDKAIKEQLADAEACHECYLEKCSNYLDLEFFTKVCSNPHPIVWAKLKGFPYWPAKCLRIVNGQADVRFFGTHDKSLVPISHVLKISKSNPSGNPKKSPKSTRITPYEEAMAELKLYVSKYEMQVGKFKFVNGKVPFQSKKISGGKKAFENTSTSQHDLSVFIKIINDAEKKFSRSASCIQNVIDEGNENVSENPSGLIIQSSFSEENNDEYPSSEMQAADEASFEVHPQLTEYEILSADSTYPSNCATSSRSLLNNNMPQNTSEHDVSSTSFGPLITSARSLNSCFSDDIGLLESYANDNGSSDQTLSNAADQSSDDVVILKEARKKTLVDGVFENRPMTKTFCEMLFSNKPNLRKYLAEYQQVFLQFFLLMYLEVNKGRLDENECKLFQANYDKLLKSIERLESQIDSLKKENAELKEKLASQLSETDQKNVLTERIMKTEKEKDTAVYLKKKLVEENRKSVELRRTMEILFGVNKGLIAEKENSDLLLKQKKKEIEDLQTALHSSKKEVANSDCQTDNKKTEDKEFQCHLVVETKDASTQVYNVLPKLPKLDPTECSNSNQLTGNIIHELHEETSIIKTVHVEHGVRNSLSSDMFIQQSPQLLPAMSMVPSVSMPSHSQFGRPMSSTGSISTGSFRKNESKFKETNIHSRNLVSMMSVSKASFNFNKKSSLQSYDRKRSNRNNNVGFRRGEKD